MKLYLNYFKLQLKSQLMYKASFIMSFLSQFVIFFSYYFTILCLFDKFSNIKGFTLYEVLLTFSIIQFGFSFCEVFFRGFDQFDDLIVHGDFDRLLLRPQSIFIQVCGSNIAFVRIAKLLQAIIILIISIIKIDISWNIFKILAIILMLLSSISIFLGIFILSASYCFLTVKGLEIRNVFTDGGKHMAQYPIGIFKKGFIFIFTFIIPYGFINYYPLIYILGKSNNYLFSFSPLIVLIYLIPCILIFKMGIKRYSSVGG